MFNVNDLLIMIKKASLDAVEASKPSDFCFGKVTNTSPLNISIEQKLTLGTAQLVLTRNVSDFKTKVSFEGEEPKEATIHNALRVGDEVILVRKKGGQKFLVLDRVVSA